MITKIREIKGLQQLIDEATAEMESLKDQIKATMTAQGVDTITVEVFKISYNSVVSNRFDSTAFKKTHHELYNQYTKTPQQFAQRPEGFRGYSLIFPQLVYRGRVKIILTQPVCRAMSALLEQSKQFIILYRHRSSSQLL